MRDMWRVSLVTRMQSLPAAVQAMRMSRSGMRMPSCRIRAFSAAARGNDSEEERITKFWAKAFTCCMLSSRRVLHSAPYRSSKSEMSDITQLSMPAWESASIVILLPRSNSIRIFVSRRNRFIIRVRGLRSCLHEWQSIFHLRYRLTRRRSSD